MVPTSLNSFIQAKRIENAISIGAREQDIRGMLSGNYNLVDQKIRDRIMRNDVDIIKSFQPMANGTEIDKLMYPDSTLPYKPVEQTSPQKYQKLRDLSKAFLKAFK